jgi:hypothetical protein
MNPIFIIKNIAAAQELFGNTKIADDYWIITFFGGRSAYARNDNC